MLEKNILGTVMLAHEMSDDLMRVCRSNQTVYARFETLCSSQTLFSLNGVLTDLASVVERLPQAELRNVQIRARVTHMRTFAGGIVWMLASAPWTSSPDALEALSDLVPSLVVTIDQTLNEIKLLIEGEKMFSVLWH